MNKGIKQYLNKGISTPIGILIILVLAVIVGTSAWYLEKNQVSESSPKPSPSATPSPTTTPPVSEEPYIEVISPNGGEEWKVGETHTIRWKSEGVEKLNIAYHLISSGKEGTVIKEDIDASLGQCFWNITDDIFPGLEYQHASVEIWIFSSDYIPGSMGNIEDRSDSTFSIDRSEEPYIKVISPNGGEELIAGESYEIEWESNKTESVVAIFLYNADISSASLSKVWQKENIPNTGYYQFMAPKNISGDNFKIYIDTKNCYDESDKPFSIVQEDETAGWETYANKEYGFKLKYPKEYYNSQKSSDDKIFFDWLSENNCIGISDLYIEFEKEKNENCNTVETIMPTSNKEIINEFSKELTDRGWPEEIEINNLTFYRKYSEDHAMGGKELRKYTYKTLYNNFCYNITLNLYLNYYFGFIDECMDIPSVDFDAGKIWEEIFYPVLSTFEFTD
jgi:hypothetical protein